MVAGLGIHLGREREREKRGRKGGRNEIFREEVVGTRREGSRERERGPLDRGHGPSKPGCKETDKKKRSFN